MNDVWPGLVLLVLLGVAGVACRWVRHARRYRWPLVEPGAGGPRRWHARTPDDCPACRAQHQAAPPNGPSSPPPWRERKGRRGAPKRIATVGYACPTPACPYYGIADERIHALVGYGHHGSSDRIQDFRCQACGTKVSARRGTALYQLKTPPQRVGEVLSALAEGLPVAAAVRVFGHGEGTITGWLVRASRQAERVHEQALRRLRLPHLQLDEIRTRLRSRRAVLWLWLALDPITKLVPVVHLGPRTQASAHTVVHALRDRLAPGCVPVVTSDGLRLYYYALTAHFGQWLTEGHRRVWHVADALLYGQVKKVYRRRRLVRVTHRVVAGTAGRLRGALQALGLSGRLNTAFVERVVVPMDTVDNSHSAWGLGIPQFRGPGAPTGQAKSTLAQRPTMSGVATRITACPRRLEAPLTRVGARLARPGARSRSPADLSPMSMGSTPTASKGST